MTRARRNSFGHATAPDNPDTTLSDSRTQTRADPQPRNGPLDNNELTVRYRFARTEARHSGASFGALIVARQPASDVSLVTDGAGVEPLRRLP